MAKDRSKQAYLHKYLSSICLHHVCLYPIGECKSKWVGVGGYWKLTEQRAQKLGGVKNEIQFLQSVCCRIFHSQPVWSLLLLAMDHACFPPCLALTDLNSLLPFLIMGSFSLLPSPNCLLSVFLFLASFLFSRHLLFLFSIPLPSLLPSYRETKNIPKIHMHIDNCLKGVLFFWCLELSLLINSLEKEMLKPLFLQKLNSVGGPGVGRKR